MSQELPASLLARLDRLRERLHRTHNGVLPVIGAGLSLPAPTGWGALLAKIAERALSDEHRASLQEFLDRRDYLTVADELEVDPGRAVISQVIAELYQRPKAARAPVYELVAALPVTHFATTNYDPWLKDAVARRHGSAPRVFTPQDPGEFTDIRPASSPLVLMLHGDADRPESCVLSQRAFRRLTHGTPAYRAGLAALASQRTLLLLGHSLTDPDLVTVLAEWIEVFGAAHGALEHVWLGAELPPSARRRMQRLGVEALSYESHAQLPAVLRYLATPPGRESTDDETPGGDTGDETPPAATTDVSTPAAADAATAQTSAAASQTAAGSQAPTSDVLRPEPTSESAGVRAPDATATLPVAARDELVLRLEACAVMRDADTRKMVIERLPAEIKSRVAHAATTRVHLTQLVQTTSAFPGGLESLRKAVHWFEGATTAMERVDEFLARIRPTQEPLQPRVLVAGPSFGLSPSVWKQLTHNRDRLPYLHLAIEQRPEVAQAQIAAILRHDVIIDLSPWRAFARWMSIGFRDIEAPAAQDSSARDARTAPQTVCLFAFPEPDENPSATPHAADAGPAQARLRSLRKASPELHERVAAAASRDGMALTGFDSLPAADSEEPLDTLAWAAAVWDTWADHTPGLVAVARPPWLPEGARFERSPGRLDGPFTDAGRDDYVRALSVVAGQVRLVGETRYRAIEDVFVEMEVERGGRWQERRRELARLSRDRDGRHIVAKLDVLVKSPETGQVGSEQASQSNWAIDAPPSPDRDAYEQLLDQEAHDWLDALEVEARLEASRVPALGPRVFLEGEAGTGKSTLLRWLAVSARGADGDNADKRVPIWVELSRLLWSDRLARGIAKQAVEAVYLTGATALVNDLCAEIEAGRATLFLDGLDEAPAGTLNALDSRLEDEIGRECHVVLSSRPQVAFTTADTDAFTGVRLWGLVPDGTKRFLRCYFGEPSWQSKLLRGLDHLPDGERWRRTPVLLALAATHLASGRELPGDTLQLYEDVVHRLLAMATTRCGAAAALADDSFEHLTRFAKERLLPDQGKARLSFQRSELPAGAHGDVLLHSGLFSGVDTLRFAHLTLGEFLAAHHLESEATVSAARTRDLRDNEVLKREVLPMALALAGVDALGQAFAERDPLDPTHSAVRLVLRALAYGGEGASAFARAHGLALVDAVVAGLCPPSGRLDEREWGLGRDAERSFAAIRHHLPSNAWQRFDWLMDLNGRLGTEAEILAWTLGAPVTRRKASVRPRSRTQLRRLAQALTHTLEDSPDRGITQMLDLVQGTDVSELRQAAVHALANDELARPSLRDLLREKDLNLRLAAVQALAKDSRSRHILRNFVRDQNWLVSQTAILVLSDDDLARPTLRELLHHKHWPVRQAAAQALVGDDRARLALRELLHYELPDGQRSAIHALTDDELSRPALRELLHNQHPAVRRAAVLVMVDDDLARPTLRELLRDENPHVHPSVA
ncbi:effector-associated domain 2-containing protein [Haliangium sp.]|uniref:effector-associated domain 2-containing protein n=1 Tax=Haliangium sp. TaxID=2663208 RepID=UPI003D10CD5E